MPPLPPNVSKAGLLRSISGWNNSSLSRRSGTTVGLLSTRTPHSSGNSGGGIPNPSLGIGVTRLAMPRNAAGTWAPVSLSGTPDPLWIMGGFSSAAAARSTRTPGGSWNQITALPTPAGSFTVAVDRSRGYWVVVLGSATPSDSYASADGVSWTPIDIQEPGSPLMYDIAVDTRTGRWVVVGISGQATTTTDPFGTWASISTSVGSNTLYGVAVHESTGRWVTVGDSTDARTTTNPTGGTWATVSLFASDTGLSVAVDQQTGLWVATGTNGSIATTTNPAISWTERTALGPEHVNGVAVDSGTGRWVVVQDNGEVRTTLDPTGTWTNMSSQFGSADLNAVSVSSNGEWVIVGDNVLYSSPDGLVWTLNSGSFGLLEDVAAL